MNTTLKPYSKEESDTIYNIFNVNPVSKTEREIYAKTIGRTYSQIASKASYEKAVRESNKPKKAYKKREQKPASISVTHLQKPATIKSSRITIGEVIVEIPSKEFSVNGVKLMW